MKEYGLIRTACAIPQVAVADTVKNAQSIITLCEKAWEAGVALVVFPELCITGYTCGDLFAQRPLMDGVETALVTIGEALRDKDRCNAAYLYCSCGTGESTTDLVFGGDALIYEKGSLLASSTPFLLEDQLIVADVDVEALSHDRLTQSSFGDAARGAAGQDWRHITFTTRDDHRCDRTFNPAPFVPADPEKRRIRCAEIFSIQSVALVSRLRHIGSNEMVVGISGGLDSTLALLVCVNACDLMGVDRGVIHAVTMPGFGTTDRTYDNAVALIKKLGATFHEISIKAACRDHLQAIGHDLTTHDVTYENAQARERTQILMDLSNMVGGIVVGTGDLSELALGCGGRHCGGHRGFIGAGLGLGHLQWGPHVHVRGQWWYSQNPGAVFGALRGGYEWGRRYSGGALRCAGYAGVAGASPAR